MKKLPKKGVLLFAAAMALCAFATPSVAPAASWGIIGTEHTLDSPNFGYTVTTPLGSVVSSCPRLSFTGTVASAGNMEITHATFGASCTAVINGSNTCTQTVVATGLPWTSTPPTTSNIQVHGVHFDVFWEESSLGTCPVALVGTSSTLTGTVSGGQWTGNGANQHEIIFSDDEGLVQHSATGLNNPITLRGTFRDTSQTLTVN